MLSRLVELVGRWDGVIRQECVAAMVVHACGKALHNRLGLCMQVSNHLVAVPAAEWLDNVKVDVPT